MSITVRELLQLPHLRLTLTAGPAGLDRQVSWVHSSDLPNPWEWLGPAELLLTNQPSLSPGEEAQVRFLVRLAETGVSGLGIGVGMAGPALSARACRRADELALPLIAVPYSVPFTAVARAVADANGREEALVLGRVARLYELLRTSVIAGRPGAEMFRRLGEELGVRRLSRPQAAEGEPGALAVEVPGAQPTVLIAEPVGGELPSLVLLHHIATGGALELAQLAAVQERQRRLGAGLLSQLLDRGIDPRLAESLIADAGLDLSVSVLAVARAGADRDGAELHRKLARTNLPHLLLDRDQMLYVVLPEGALDGSLTSALAESARV